MSSTVGAAGSTIHWPINEPWLATLSEEIIEPDLPIIDAHHHLMDRPLYRYLLPEFLADVNTGHNVKATVFVQASAMYRADGPVEYRTVGETEFVNGCAAMSASGLYGPTRACAGIVSHVDLLVGDGAKPVLEAHIAAGNGRFRGIRHSAARDASPAVRTTSAIPPEGLLADQAFRKGFAALAPLGLSFDAWVYHPQIGEVCDLARAFPETSIILDHLGGPVGVGPYADRRADVFAAWKASLRELASCPNVFIKMGGLAMRISGFDFPDHKSPADVGDPGRGLSTLHRDSDRALRRQALHVRKQLPDRQGRLQLSGPLECVQAGRSRAARSTRNRHCSTARRRQPIASGLERAVFPPGPPRPAEMADVMATALAFRLSLARSLVERHFLMLGVMN